MKIKKFIPPCIDLMKEMIWLISALLIYLLITICSFSGSYISSRDELYIRQGKQAILITLREMKPFDQIIVHKFRFFWFFILVCIFAAVINYRSFYKDRSIYVMKRLPDANNLHVRSLTLPLVTALAGIVITALLFGIFVLVYLYCTPYQCLPVWHGPNIVGAFL